MTRYLRQPFVMALLLVVVLSVAEASEMYRNIPAGTELQVRITEKLSSETANIGDEFHGTLVAPVIVKGRRLFSKGADVTGEVVNVERSGRLSRPGELDLALRTVRSGGRTYAVAAQPFVIKGQSHTKSNVTKIGGGATVGAIIGAITAGGKGAAIGAGIGAAAGTGVAAATGMKPAEVESEAVLTWVAANPSTGAALQGQGRPQPGGDYYAEAQEHPGKKRYSHDDDYDGRGPTGFSDRERQVIGDCFVNERVGLPPGLAKKDHLPPGLERQLQRDGTLPPGLQKRVQPLPGECTASLPRLPRDWARVLLSGRVILLDPQQRIVDLFWLVKD
jgi:outer membrane lipoprotein SlyB